MSYVETLPVEEKFYELEIDGKTVLIPGLNKVWVDNARKNFSRYIGHPDPGRSDFLEEKALWLEITHFVVEDLEWLLRQSHHVFWSHMIYSMEAQWLLLTFLQEAPPYYVRKEFPKDEEMERSFAKAEHLAFLVLRRLATVEESKEGHVRNLGDLLYNSYLFTIPIFFDIFAIYGYNNRQLVADLFQDVVSRAPRFLQDLEIVPPFFMKVLQIVKEKFETRAVPLVKEKNKLRPDSLKNVFLHLHDTTANMQIFFDINTKYAKCMRTEAFLSDIAFFYSSIIPKINEYFSTTTIDALDSFKEKLDFVRLNFLSIVRSIFCCTINDVVNDEQNREEYANEYLTRLMDVIQEPLFISDYNKVYPIEADLKLLSDLCPNLDSVNMKYISDAVAAYSVVRYKPGDLKEFRLASLISEVTEVLPDLGDGFVEFCLKFYGFDTGKVITAILEDSLPTCLDKLDRNMQRPDEKANKIMRARISAEKQFRMDKAIGTGKLPRKPEAASTSAANDDVSKPGPSGINTKKMDKAGTSAESGDVSKPGPSGINNKKMDKTGTGAASAENVGEPGPSAANNQKQGKGGTGKQQKKGKSSTKDDANQKVDEAVTSGGKKHKKGKSSESNQKVDEARASGEKQEVAKPSTSRESNQQPEKAEKAEKAATSVGKKVTAKAGMIFGVVENIDKPVASGGSKPKSEKPGTSAASNQEMIDFLNDKADLQDIRDRIVNLSLISEEYDDEYDDTYDEKSVFLKETRNVDEERKALDPPRLLHDVADDRSDEEEGSGPQDRVAEKPADVKARLIQRRMDKLRSDFVAKKKGSGGASTSNDASFILGASTSGVKRDPPFAKRIKDMHKAAIANYNRRTIVTRKRIINLAMHP